MAIDKHGVYAAAFHNTVVSGLTGQVITVGSQTNVEASAAEVYGRIASIVGRTPGATFSTRCVAQALDACSLTGFAISTSALFKLWAYKHTAGGMRAGPTSHRLYQFSNGIVYPTRLSVQHGQDATISYQAVATYDGTNAPLAATDSETVPAGLSDDERFTIGPVTLGTKTLTGITSIDLDFGVQVSTEAGDSDTYPRIVSIDTISPVIRIRGKDLLWWASGTVPTDGLACTHANTAIYLRKRANGGLFVVDGTAEHIKLTASGVCAVNSAFETDGSSGAMELVLQCSYDGVNAPLVFDTTSAIT